MNLITGGPAKSDMKLALNLAELGHEVEVFSTWWPHIKMPCDTMSEQNRVLLRLFPITTIPGLAHLPYSYALLRAVREEFGRFDICHAFSLWNPLISHTMTLFRQQQVPYALTPHGMMDPVVFARHRAFKWCWARLWERRNVEAADLIQFTSERERTKAERQGWHLRKTLVLPHSIEVSKGQNLPPRTQLEQTYPQLVEKEVIAFVGRINWVKNLDLLIQAVAILRKEGRNVALVCAGPDSDNHQTYLERKAEALGIGDLVLFTGFLEGAALRAVFGRADVVALVSRKENFGLSAAEALAEGIPVVLSNGVDMGEHWTAPPVWRAEETATSIADGLGRALSYSRRVGLPAREARELAQREWGTSSVSGLVKSYERIIAEHQ